MRWRDVAPALPAAVLLGGCAVTADAQLKDHTLCDWDQGRCTLNKGAYDVAVSSWNTVNAQQRENVLADVNAKCTEARSFAACVGGASEAALRHVCRSPAVEASSGICQDVTQPWCWAENRALDSSAQQARYADVTTGSRDACLARCKATVGCDAAMWRASDKRCHRLRGTAGQVSRKQQGVALAVPRSRCAETNQRAAGPAEPPSQAAAVPAAQPPTASAPPVQASPAFGGEDVDTVRSGSQENPGTTREAAVETRVVSTTYSTNGKVNRDLLIIVGVLIALLTTVLVGGALFVRRFLRRARVFRFELNKPPGSSSSLECPHSGDPESPCSTTAGIITLDAAAKTPVGITADIVALDSPAQGFQDCSNPALTIPSANATSTPTSVSNSGNPSYPQRQESLATKTYENALADDENCGAGAPGEMWGRMASLAARTYVNLIAEDDGNALDEDRWTWRRQVKPS